MFDIMNESIAFKRTGDNVFKYSYLFYKRLLERIIT